MKSSAVKQLIASKIKVFVCIIYVIYICNIYIYIYIYILYNMFVLCTFMYI